MCTIKSIYFTLILSIFMVQNAKTQDWANLKKYQNENAILKSLKPEPKRIVLMGDSITEFWSTLNPDFFIGKPFVNRGISGQTSPQMLLRFRTDVIALKPNIVVILAGTNDIAENTGPITVEMIAKTIFSMAELAKVNHIKVILCSVLPAFDFPWKKGLQPAEKIVTLNKMIEKYAHSNQIVYLDYYSVMVNEHKGLISRYSDDGVHPNKTGYEVMNPLLEKAILLTLK
ncbi:SGNH/GDSL hydrolase family protein [Flavobacterium sp.]|uniref:SGNH/GDSL hydrolase family protein n=1 Tax=Flavobacterium sp. TaxID=239 RepID=UPI00286A9052|nr:SGNH/GDSL hydrolase family protein [Flavobacterium sp.]